VTTGATAMRLARLSRAATRRYPQSGRQGITPSLSASNAPLQRSARAGLPVKRGLAFGTSRSDIDQCAKDSVAEGS
jgi:hypothetical protein